MTIVGAAEKLISGGDLGNAAAVVLAMFSSCKRFRVRHNCYNNLLLLLDSQRAYAVCWHALILCV